MNFIGVDQLVRFHNKILNATGGSDGVRDKAILESALQRPFSTFDGNDLYEGTIHKISVATYSLIKNHGFVDGNKRIGVATMLLLLRMNGITIKYSQDELIELGLSTAEGKMKENDIYQWIQRHQV
ncbi:type II toxin-antitoxin system death-on-curing family toxin [Gorillibacterium sp. sgz5001074]|uniref:type II toxin-antitoxin system death-on-curing family toxin n=1 Tax=Gorillibacterium sp. sgz5001074 TaxID=3446695 RepID=UPI003F66A14F